MRTLVLLLALLPLVTACKKELGELCSDGSECETEICRDVPPGSSVTKICAASQPCPDDAINIGECLRPCSEGCPEGTYCDPVLRGLSGRLRMISVETASAWRACAWRQRTKPA
jgi:hypothetical protein